MKTIDKLQETRIREVVINWASKFAPNCIVKPIITDDRKDFAGLTVYSRQNGDELALIEFNTNVNGKNIVFLNQDNPVVFINLSEVQKLNNNVGTLIDRVRQLDHENLSKHTKIKFYKVDENENN